MDETPTDPERVDALAEELYDLLRSLARSALRRLPGGLDPTELVHQAWLGLSERFQNMPRVEFLALCATIMRRLAVDEARRHNVRGGSADRLTLSGLAGETTGGPVDLLALDEALEGLREANGRWARIVELRFFGGLSGEEVAQVMGVSRRTVTREWTLARAWLKRALG